MAVEGIMAMKSWEVSEEFWSRVEQLIPAHERDESKTYKRSAGAGRKRMSARKVFEAIVFVLRTGCQWKAIPKEVFGSASSIHKYFLDWAKAGLFKSIWKAGLAEYDEMEGIAWHWQSIDGAMMKAPMAKEAVGPNPTDRGKKWKQKAFVSRRAWCPVVNRRNRSEQA